MLEMQVQWFYSTHDSTTKSLNQGMLSCVKCSNKRNYTSLVSMKLWTESSIIFWHKNFVLSVCAGGGGPTCKRVDLPCCQACKQKCDHHLNCLYFGCCMMFLSIFMTQYFYKHNHKSQNIENFMVLSNRLCLHEQTYGCRVQ